MLTKLQFKMWARSGSLRFAKPSAATGELQVLRWRGHDLYYRSGTSDTHLIHSILLKRSRKGEYHIPAPLHPRVILDIGANIGAAAVYFASTYPAARVVCVEPVPANFAVLQRNIAAFPAIEAHNVALGAHDGTLSLIESPDASNQGGFSAFQRGADADASRIEVACRDINKLVAEVGGAPDIIKIDTEGFESTILRALAPETLAQVRWILGELHGEDDFELLAYLSRWFEIGIRKSIKGPLCNFHARNRALVKA